MLVLFEALRFDRQRISAWRDLNQRVFPRLVRPDVPTPLLVDVGEQNGGALYRSSRAVLDETTNRSCVGLAPGSQATENDASQCPHDFPPRPIFRPTGKKIQGDTVF